MDELFQLFAKTYGIAGLLVLAPFIGIFYLWRQNVKLHKSVGDVQEKRIEDAKAISTKLMEIVEEQGAQNRESNIALDQVRDLLMRITVQKDKPPRQPTQQKEKEIPK